MFWTQRFSDYFGVPTNGLVIANYSSEPSITQADYGAMMGLQLRELAGYGFQEFWVNGRM